MASTKVVAFFHKFSFKCFFPAKCSWQKHQGLFCCIWETKTPNAKIKNFWLLSTSKLRFLKRKPQKFFHWNRKKNSSFVFLHNVNWRFYQLFCPLIWRYQKFLFCIGFLMKRNYQKHKCQKNHCHISFLIHQSCRWKTCGPNSIDSFTVFKGKSNFSFLLST